MKRMFLREGRKTASGAVNFFRSGVLAARWAVFLAVGGALCVVGLEAQSISIANPGAGIPTITGSSNTLTVSYSGSAITKVCYLLDAYPLYDPGIDAPTTLGCSVTAPFSIQYNSYWNGNGPHTLAATAYNALGTVVATSASVPFTIANTYPNPNNLQMSVSYGTSTSSPWSGAVAVTPSFTGTGAGTDALAYSLYVNGVLQDQVAGTFTSSTLYAQTTLFQNGPANVCVVVYDSTSGLTVSGDVGNFIGGTYESCAQVTIANPTSPETPTDIALTNAHDIYLTPGGASGGNCSTAAVGSGSCTLTASILNVDGTTSSGTPVFCAAVYHDPLNGGTSSACTNSSPYGGNLLPFTVNSSTGVITASTGGLGYGAVIAMVPNVSGSDLAVYSGITASVYRTGSTPFNQSMVGEAINITGGTNWTPGMWVIAKVSSGGVASVGCGGNSQNLCPAPAGATGGTFTLGPARQDNVYVAPSNTTPCFGPNGVVYTSYNSSCYVMHTMFSSSGYGGLASAIMADQPYNPGAAADFSQSGLNTYEIADTPGNAQITGQETSGGFSAWDANLQSFISQQEAICATVSNCHLFLIDGGGLVSSWGALWGTTYGLAASWSTPPFQDMVSRWSAQGNVTAINEGDEFHYGNNSLQGPITYGSGSGQSFLQSITASSGVCTASIGPGAAPSGGAWGWTFNAANEFVIHGSAISGMNSASNTSYIVSGSTPGSGAVAVASASGSTVTITMINQGSGYTGTAPTVALVGGGGTYTSATPTISGGAITGITVSGASGYTSNPTVLILNGFTFSCPSVANGTYNASNDSGLVMEPSAAWVENSLGAYEYVPYDVFAKEWTQASNVSPHLALGAAPVGATIGAGVQAFAPWFGNTLNYSQSIGSVTQTADFADLYPYVGTSGFMISRYAAQALLVPGNIAQTIRSTYGLGYSPSLPLVTLTHGDDGNYWAFDGTSVGVSSCSGHLITFSSPHGVTNIIPGMSRLKISGATDTGSPQDTSNQTFIIWDAPTPTTLDVTLGATDQTGNAASGTMNFQDGSTFNVSGSITASGQVLGGSSNCQFTGWPWSGRLCGDPIVANYYTVPATKRGQTFTFTSVSGGSSPNPTYFEGRTFQLAPENLADTYETTSNTMTLIYRQVPVLSATGGTATILTDNNWVKGPRNPSGELAFGSPYGSNDGSENPGWAYGTSVLCWYLRCAGERIYGWLSYNSGYDSQKLGFTGPSASNNITIGSTNVSNQQFMNQHFENTGMVPVWHAKNAAALVWNRWQKYSFQPRLNSPDYGPYVECMAAGGSPGNILSCINVSDGPQTITFNLSPYLVSGQQIIEQVSNDHSIGPDTILSAGTTSATLTLQPYDTPTFVFPSNFAAELQQPSISARLADVANATDIVVRWSYDRYYLDVAGDTYDCGTGTCTPSWDRNIGTIYYRLLYRNSSGQVIATSDILQP